jgi:hypothetical protein
MQALRARVRNGRITLDEPTDFPEGKEVNLVLVDDDGLNDEERRRLLEAIDQSMLEADAGEVESVSKLIADLRAQL